VTGDRTPEVVAPSGVYGFRQLENVGGPVVQVVENTSGRGWLGTPASYYAADVARWPAGYILSVSRVVATVGGGLGGVPRLRAHGGRTVTGVGTCRGCGRVATINAGRVGPHERPGCPGTGKAPRGAL
jgi:hypothetical protein